jgi:hypothetical protein
MSEGAVMSIPCKTGKLMPPLHPGEMLREEFLIPLRMTAKMLAREIKVPERRVIAIVRKGADSTEICACGWRGSSGCLRNSG